MGKGRDFGKKFMLWAEGRSPHGRKALGTGMKGLLKLIKEAFTG